MKLIHLFYQQELQQEMETKSQSLNSLDTSGRKLLGSLSSQEDAVMLQRRLEEMNQRWNQLKNRSVTIRLVSSYIYYLNKNKYNINIICIFIFVVIFQYFKLK